MRTIIILFTIALFGCMQPAEYIKNENMSQLDKDKAACDVLASNARNPYFPDNPFLNQQAYGRSYDSCMQSKGYTN